MRREGTGHTGHGCREVRSGEVPRERRPCEPSSCVGACPGWLTCLVGGSGLKGPEGAQGGAHSPVSLGASLWLTVLLKCGRTSSAVPNGVVIVWNVVCRQLKHSHDEP